MSVAEQKIDTVNRFIELANSLASDGVSAQVVSSGLMTACAIYATYVVTGNDGALRESGVEKLAKLFGEELSTVQQAKIDRARQEGKDVSSSETAQ